MFFLTETAVVLLLRVRYMIAPGYVPVLLCSQNRSKVYSVMYHCCTSTATINNSLCWVISNALVYVSGNRHYSTGDTEGLILYHLPHSLLFPATTYCAPTNERDEPRDDRERSPDDAVRVPGPRLVDACDPSAGRHPD